ncbi:MAG TPA: hypothetical protein VJ485_00585 [archaeon]|nr:hypothetical protein [archaeon]
MKLFFASLAIAIILVLNVTFAQAPQLATFAADSVHMHMGKNSLVKTYISNPDSSYANITVWLGGDYPTGLAKFSQEAGVYYTADQRNFTVPLNPREQKVFTLLVVSTGPKADGSPYKITLRANTTDPSGRTSSGNMDVFMDYAPNFPGLETWGILLIIAVSSLLMGRIWIYYEQPR